MRKIVLNSFYLVAILTLGSAIILPVEIDKANSDGTPLSLTFIANEGVLIESPTEKS